MNTPFCSIWLDFENLISKLLLSTTSIVLISVSDMVFQHRYRLHTTTTTLLYLCLIAIFDDWLLNRQKVIYTSMLHIHTYYWLVPSWFWFWIYVLLLLCDYMRPFISSIVLVLIRQRIACYWCNCVWGLLLITTYYLNGLLFTIWHTHLIHFCSILCANEWLTWHTCIHTFNTFSCPIHTHYHHSSASVVKALSSFFSYHSLIHTHTHLTHTYT